jgi:hypothetical protein
MPVCLDPMRQVCQLWISQQFGPALEVESGLLGGGL